MREVEKICLVCTINEFKRFAADVILKEGTVSRSQTIMIEIIASQTSKIVKETRKSDCIILENQDSSLKKELWISSTVADNNVSFQDGLRMYILSILAENLLH